MDVCQLDHSRVDEEATQDNPGKMVGAKFNQIHGELLKFSNVKAVRGMQAKVRDILTKRNYKSKR